MTELDVSQAIQLGFGSIIGCFFLGYFFSVVKKIFNSL